MNILVINCGSSSLKYQLIDSGTEEVLAKGLCERIGIDKSVLTHTPAGRDKVKIETPMPNHTVAVRLVIDALTDAGHGVVKSLDEISAVGHRVVHGGEKFASSVVIDDAVLKAIEECNDLAPLHNPANLIGINSCREIMPNVPMVAVFDTAFHQTMPEKAYLYGLPYEYYEILGKTRDALKIIVCHLGNGGSVSAVDHGKCVDTSMGLTPLEGIIMGTRSGSIDPAICDFICQKEGLTPAEMNSVLNKKSGVLGMSKVSSDFRDIEAAADDGNRLARVTLDAFYYSVAKYIGAYAAAMNGVDAIAFTAGVGENNIAGRAEIAKYLGYLGTEIDAERNNVRGEDRVISTDASRVALLCVPTNEELAIARQTVALVK